MKLTDSDYLDYACPLHVLNTDGFTNLKKNVMLLKKYNGDPDKVREHYEIDDMLTNLKTQKRALLYKDQLEDQGIQQLSEQEGLPKVIKLLHRFDGDTDRCLRHVEQKRLKFRAQLTQSAPSSSSSLDQLSSSDDSDSLPDSLLSDSNPFEPSYYCDIDIDLDTNDDHDAAQHENVPFSSAASPSSHSHSHFRSEGGRDRRLSNSLTRIEKKIKKLNSRRRRIEEKIRGSSSLFSAIALA
eukprot:CAMPEP_0184345660 /NCGR_PEP_ID=MMETSP1089-20130417/14044_1 /TAXON_ID=38269 ORGANISM="Gloeochaete wittrockiana, Strain SAG46.84" /NCGR_SAMPLE_ID=MMETSP1089 /ASSEMBLY_ACC=CAM_ASM_000445 /LENGTH=239 /DNA_ID=CAMNT_0026676049 /DNA_START=156 /DNA_END=875 /DNA_ORIENTATION=+